MLPPKRRKSLALLCVIALMLPITRASAAVRRGSGEFLINTHWTGSQSGGSLVELGDAGILVLFTGSTVQYPTNIALQARRYAADGTAVGEEYLVNRGYKGFNEVLPSVTGLGASGQYAVTWTDVGSEDIATIKGVVLNSSGEPQGDPVQLSADSPFIQEDSDIAGAPAGFLVVWVDLGDRNVGASNVLARLCDASGKPITGVVAVPLSTDGWPARPRVAALNNGAFLVAWEELDTDGSADGIVARRLDSAGVVSGDPFIVNKQTTGPQQDPDIATLTDGRLVVVWRGDDGDNGGIFGRILDADGTPVGEDFAVNTYIAGAQEIPSVIADKTGGFLVTWVSGGQDGSGNAVMARHYLSTGKADGNPFQANISVAGDQMGGHQDAVFTTSDSFMMSWRDSSDHRDGSGSASIGARFLIAPGDAALCGDAARGDLIITAADALASLRASVGSMECPACICDVDGNQSITATDALTTLKAAVGLAALSDCPSC